MKRKTFAMNFQKLFLLCCCILAAGSVRAQNDADALRYSMIQPGGGTARSLGAGGAFGALGADFSSLSINPAGIALYHGNEFTFSPQFESIHTSSSFDSTLSSGNRNNFNFSNVGLVFTSKNKNEKSEWKSVHFGFGMNRMQSYHSSDYFYGINYQNSLMDHYAASANGSTTNDLLNNDPFGAGLAYDAGLILPGSPDSTYYYPQAYFPGAVSQERSSVTRGAYKEYLISMGGNYGDKLYLGLTIGIDDLNYKYNSDYTEKDVDNLYDTFNSFTLNETVHTSGTGVNVKGGLIYRVNDYFRLGASGSSPTYFSMTDTYANSIVSDMGVNGTYDVNSPQGKFNYNLTTPWRVTGSAAFIFKKYGFLSVDYDYLDYSSMFFTFNSGGTDARAAEQQINNDILAKYGAASNLRIGAEGAIDIFRIRAGVDFCSTPFKDQISNYGADYSSHTYSGGLGVREKGYSLDLAYNRTLSKTFYQPYLLNNQSVPGSLISNTISNITLTLGLRF